ncbi:hypothetical protein AOLI_G00122750 [Acnodon oligacanthus]
MLLWVKPFTTIYRFCVGAHRPTDPPSPPRQINASKLGPFLQEGGASSNARANHSPRIAAEIFFWYPCAIKQKPAKALPTPLH